MAVLAPARNAPAPAPPARPWSTLPVLAGALALTLGLRALYVGVPLGIDEGGVSYIAKAWGTGGHGSLYGSYWLDRPPLLLVLYKAAIMAGPSGVRILGAIAALALVGVTTLATRAVAGDRAACIAALLSTVLASSVALTAVFTPAELLASVPAAGSIGCLLATHRSGRARWLVGAGLLAVAAALIKQSFLDAGFAGVVFLLLTGRRPRRLAAYFAGALLALAPVVAWLAIAHIAPGRLVYALFGFRITALHTLATSAIPLQARVHSLLGPALGSGLIFALVIAVTGFFALPRDRVVLATLAAWLAAGVVGVLAGGTYWPHYLIQLVAPVSLLASAALARVPLVPRVAAVGAIAAIAVTVTIVGASVPHPRQREALAAARYVRTHARPDDTDYVLYARANVDYYAGLPTPFPYAWSLLIRAVPGTHQRLVRLLDSPRRPTWIVGWQPPRSWRFDPTGAIAHALKAHYRVAARVDGHPIYHATQRTSP